MEKSENNGLFGDVKLGRYRQLIKSIEVCEYSRSFHDDKMLQDQASGERSGPIVLWFTCKWTIQFYLAIDNNYTPGIYADGYIVFAFPFVCSLVRSFVSSFVSSWCISLELMIRNHSYFNQRYPIGFAMFL